MLDKAGTGKSEVFKQMTMGYSKVSVVDITKICQDLEPRDRLPNCEILPGEFSMLPNNLNDLLT